MIVIDERYIDGGQCCHTDVSSRGDSISEINTLTSTQPRPASGLYPVTSLGTTVSTNSAGHQCVRLLGDGDWRLMGGHALL